MQERLMSWTHKHHKYKAHERKIEKQRIWLGFDAAYLEKPPIHLICVQVVTSVLLDFSFYAAVTSCEAHDPKYIVVQLRFICLAAYDDEYVGIR